MIERVVAFSEDGVQEWCDTHNDDNSLHTDADVAEESVFGQRVVPGMMLLNQLSGMAASLGEDYQTVILAGITAARFRDPVFFDEDVQFTLSDVQDGQNFSTVEFEIRAIQRDNKLVANGVLSLVID